MKISLLLSHIDLTEVMRVASKVTHIKSDHRWVPAFNLLERVIGPVPGTGVTYRFTYPEETVINTIYRGVDNPNAIITPQQVFREIVDRNDDNIDEIFT